MKKEAIRNRLETCKDLKSDFDSCEDEDLIASIFEQITQIDAQMLQEKLWTTQMLDG